MVLTGGGSLCVVNAGIQRDGYGFSACVKIGKVTENNRMWILHRPTWKHVSLERTRTEREIFSPTQGEIAPVCHAGPRVSFLCGI